MQSHSIKDLLDLPELFIRSTQKMDGHIYIDAEPVASHQPCPVCASTKTIRRGVNSIRKVRHLDAFGCAVYLHLPAIRIDNRYHVNRYVTEALQTARKFIQKELSPVDKKELSCVDVGQAK